MGIDLVCNETAQEKAENILDGGLIYTRLIELKKEDYPLGASCRYKGDGWSLWLYGENTYVSVLGVGIFLIEI